MNLAKAVYWIFGFVICTVALYASFVLWLVWPITESSLSKLGEFGDSFGVVTSLFTGLAFGGLILTILHQREELKESREIFRRQRFEASFYRLLDYYRHNLYDIRITDHETSTAYEGIDALSFVLKKLSAAMQKYNHYLASDDGRKLYEAQLFIEVQRILTRQSRYLGSLESLLSLVQNDLVSEEERVTFWNIIASQLTAMEIRYIFYQCLVAPEGDTLRILIHKAALVAKRLPDTNIGTTHLDLYSRLHGVNLEPRKRKPLLPYARKEIRRMKRKLREAERSE